LTLNKPKDVETIINKYGYTDYKWVNPEDIVVSQWVRMKCMFGCSEYGKNASCPPNTPSVEECRQLFSEYKVAVIFHFEKRVKKPEDRHQWSKIINEKLSKLEKEVFLFGYHKTLLLFMDSCNICPDCQDMREKCKYPEISRPSAEAMAIDVFSTIRKYGFQIEVLSEYSEKMNRYAFLFIE